MSGSSPHTRGLQGVRGQCAAGEGIIPAHAGFTAGGAGGRRGTPDHPRTRGVYSDNGQTALSNLGSSPHTRGLRPGLRLPALRGRIIPAHAGFTRTSSLRLRRRRDHPRTRGVYATADGARTGSTGSSPHTRGLLAIPVIHGLRAWIIPAHAGFTPGRGWCRVPWWDHPRTRGVYSTA